VTRTLSTLISSGVPILDALTITSRTAGNKVVERAHRKTPRASIAGGHTIADPLTESKVFPPMVCQMISVGETTGALDAMLGKIADFYDSEVDQTVNNMMALMEPMVILFLGVVIGGLVVAMYLPIFKLGSVIQWTLAGVALMAAVTIATLSRSARQLVAARNPLALHGVRLPRRNRRPWHPACS